MQRLRRDAGGSVVEEREPDDLTTQYNTPLSPDDEARYQAWGQAQAAQGRPNPAADTFDYDMRGFWKSGEPVAANGHSGDAFKKPNHPTFSNQSRYSGADGATGGTWSGGQDGAPWGYTPSQTNLKNLGVSGMERYFNDRERGNYLMLPQTHQRGGVIHRDDGGAASLPVQTTGMQSPMAQQQYSYFQNMTPEQLQEQALKLKGSPQGQMVQQLLAQKRIMGSSPQQATQSNPQAGLPQTYALGGSLETKGGAHFPEHGISDGATGPTSGGFLHTSGPGRSDNLNITPHADSYVLPADVVSGMGEGNSLAGAKALEGAFGGHQGPGGIPLATKGQHIGHRMGPPKPPGGFAQGGAASEPQKVPIVAAGGEYVVGPDQVKALGHGDIKRGHAILDAFVLHVRKRTIGEMKKLKGPVKS